MQLNQTLIGQGELKQMQELEMLLFDYNHDVASSSVKFKSAQETGKRNVQGLSNGCYHHFKKQALS